LLSLFSDKKFNILAIILKVGMLLAI